MEHCRVPGGHAKAFESAGIPPPLRVLIGRTSLTAPGRLKAKTTESNWRKSSSQLCTRILSMLESAKLLATAAILSIALAIPTAPIASAQSGVTAGFLKCNVAGNLSFIFGSSRDISCIYDAGGGWPPDYYRGTINKYGVDIGFQANGVIIWGVIAPGVFVGPGALTGVYAGVTADVAVGLGVGANVLVGGSQNNIALQPLSVEGMQGLNVAGGLGVLTLVHAQ
jgi:hypothetical protein